MNLLKNKPPFRTYMIQTAVAVLLIAALLVLDFLTKAAAEYAAWDGNGNIVVIENFFSITFTKNTGAAWSLGSGSDFFMTAVIVLTFVAIAVMLTLIFFPDKRKNMLFIVALSMITAGATGNLVDRLWLGYVRDMINIDLFGWTDFPVFNIADVALVVGVIVMIVWIVIAFVRSSKNDKEKKKREEDDDDEDDE